jgi:hypothetical protein
MGVGSSKNRGYIVKAKVSKGVVYLSLDWKRHDPSQKVATYLHQKI